MYQFTSFETLSVGSLRVLSCVLPQPLGAREGGAHRGGGGLSARLPPGQHRTQHAAAERRARPGGGSSRRGAGVGRGLATINPGAGLKITKEQHSREKNKTSFFFVRFKAQATSKDIVGGKIKNSKQGLKTFVTFQTQKPDCGALLHLRVLLSRRSAQRCNTTYCIHTKPVHTHTHLCLLVKPRLVLLPG